ncbi:tetratricopeptide repeat protein [Fulvivirga sp. 29W222]|uniref:Tetratricopeptide repeat protein n=1 Tax=Fulvivirga marina TaxID=2494733 RepID=A0A937KB15_9BACT|nr:tetratricopeptide repeat protein [Fulvivirga marina]MBL6445279.1 tetratricopeptide repeat protein [Fulvivirga marina]
MKNFFTVIFITLSFQLYAQKDIDSLSYLLDNYKDEDTIKVDLFNKLGYEYWIVNPSKSELLGEQALMLARRLYYEKGKAFANRVIGVAHWTRGNYEEALEYLFEGLVLYKNIDDSLGQANCLMNIGLVFSDQHNNEKALKYYYEAVGIFEELKKFDRIATTYNKIGTILLDEEKYDEAYNYLIKALNIHQNNAFKYGISEANNRLGLLFLKQKEYQRSLQHFLRSFEIGKEINDREGMAKNLENLGYLYIERRDYDSAIYYFDQGLRLANEVRSKKWLKDIYLGMKLVYEQQNNYSRALLYANKYNAMRDSLFNEEMATRIANMQTRIETVEKEKELELQSKQIALLEHEAQYDNILKWFLFVGLALIMLIGYLIIKYQQTRIKKDRALYQSKEELSKVALENVRLKKEELELELNYKNKELTSYTMNFIQKNELIKELKEAIQQIVKRADAPMRKDLGKLIKLIDSTIGVDKDWENFKLFFEQVHQDFFDQLKAEFPELTGSDLKLCALVRLNLSMKETSALLGISTESVKTARYRLRKKLNLESGENLMGFLIRFNQE